MTKRLFDFTLSLVGLVVFAPVLVAVAIWIKLDSPGPVFYRGRRVGRLGKPFRIFKFRSMVVNADKIGGSSTSDHDPRMTRSGRFVRKYKLDELPQLINVLVGDMSLVGPRPEVQEFVDMYTEEEQIILQLRPGITDWASLWNSDEGAVLKHFDDPDQAYLDHIRPTKVRLQVEYARSHSLRTDIRIIYLTLLRIVRRDFAPKELSHCVDLMEVARRHGTRGGHPEAV